MCIRDSHRAELRFGVTDQYIIVRVQNNVHQLPFRGHALAAARHAEIKAVPVEQQLAVANDAVPADGISAIVDAAPVPVSYTHLDVYKRQFPASFLSEWAAGRQLERTGGQHIGIANAAQRLQLAYGDRAKLLLYNSPLGGAVVELHIPCISQEEAVP